MGVYAKCCVRARVAYCIFIAYKGAAAVLCRIRRNAAAGAVEPHEGARVRRTATCVMCA